MASKPCAAAGRRRTGCNPVLPPARLHAIEPLVVVASRGPCWRPLMGMEGLPGRDRTSGADAAVAGAGGSPRNDLMPEEDDLIAFARGVTPARVLVGRAGDGYR